MNWTTHICMCAWEGWCLRSMEWCLYVVVVLCPTTVLWA